jgi:hypothetical protein|tara:strand:- start:490 stop:729 length:240 start_codon:yes stop_codon:yes gene_type:complete
MNKSKGIYYYKDRQTAEKVVLVAKERADHMRLYGNLNIWGNKFPISNPRVVEYDKGYAVQYRISGPYYPQNPYANPEEE